MPSCTPCRKWGIRCEYNNNPEPAVPASSGVSLPATSKPPISRDDAPSEAQISVTSQIAEMPSKEVILDLADIFLSRFRAQIPCFHERRLQESIEHGEIQANAPVLVYIIIAMAARDHTDESIRCQERGWYTNAKLAFDLTTHDSEPALRILQAAACLIYYANIVRDVSPLWIFLGKAWRLACSHGYNRIDTKRENAPAFASPASSEVEREERRRTMWTLFMFDRGGSFGIGWPHAINEKYFVVNQPLDDRAFQTDELGSSIVSATPDPLRILTTTYKIAGRVEEHTHILEVPDDLKAYQREFRQLDADIIAVAGQSTEQIRNLRSLSPRNQFQVVWAHVLIHTAIVILHHRPLENWAIISEGSTDTSSLEECHERHFQHCLHITNTIVQLVKSLKGSFWGLLMNPQIGSPLYIFGRLLIICWHDTQDLKYKQDIDLIIVLFENFTGVYQGLGQRYVEEMRRDFALDSNSIQRMRALGSKGGVSGCQKLRG